MAIRGFMGFEDHDTAFAFKPSGQPVVLEVGGVMVLELPGEGVGVAGGEACRWGWGLR